MYNVLNDLTGISLYKDNSMNKNMLIIENEYKIPPEIIEWAEKHSVPLVTGTLNNFYDKGYSFLIEYSPECSIDYLEISFCHAHDLPAVIGRTEQLIIREIGPEDCDIYRTLLRMNPEVLKDKTLAELSSEEFRSRHLAYIKYSYHFLGYGIWGIFLLPESISDSDAGTVGQFENKPGEMIGIAGIDGTDSPELSYALFEKYQGKGYAYEACSFILGYAENELNIKNISIFVKRSNIRSAALAGRLKKEHPSLIIQEQLY